jgi:site-specific DNA-methyltransferase (adenine-specific)
MKNNNEIQIQFVPIELLEYNEGQIPGVPENPRTREDAKQRNLEKSIEELPEMTIARAALCFPYNGRYVVIGGNRRLEAQRALKRKEVPIIALPENTPVEKLRRMALLYNESTGQTDWAKIAKDWNKDEIRAWNIETPKGWFNEPPKRDIQEDDISKVKAKQRCHQGDIWQLGDYRLMCGDSTKTAMIQELLAGEKVDLYITDPPYNVAYEGKTKDALTIQNDEMNDDSFREFLVNAFMAADSVMKEGASFYIWHADSEGYNFRYAVKHCGWLMKQCLIWNKNTMVMGRQDYQWKHEPCLYGWKAGASHHWYSDRKQTTVLEFNKPNRNAEHPTMKPVELFAYQIQNSSHKGDIVLDSFGGSGTSIIACEQVNRKCYMMELDPHYCNVILARWEQFTGKKAKKISGG